MGLFVNVTLTQRTVACFSEFD